MATFSVFLGPDFAILPVRGDASARSSLTPLPGIVDGFLTEEHTLRLSKTSYPVESGQSLTDHAVIEPRTLKLEGWVSDLLAPAGEAGASRGLEAWQRITELMESREPILVVTTLGVYENMLITSVKAPVDRTTGRALQFEMELEEVLFRALERGQRPPPVRIGPAEHRPVETNRGRVQALPAEEIDEVLNRIRDEIASGLPADKRLWQHVVSTVGRTIRLGILPLSPFFRS